MLHMFALVVGIDSPERLVSIISLKKLYSDSFTDLFSGWTKVTSAQLRQGVSSEKAKEGWDSSKWESMYKNIKIWAI